jgi:hypothetical protein
MSAFVCSDRQFAVVAKSLFVDARRQQQFADALKRENIKSVNHRYGERTRVTRVKLSACPETEVSWYLPDDVAALLNCIDYQSCEHPDYNDVHYKLAELLLHARGANPQRSQLWCI